MRKVLGAAALAAAFLLPATAFARTGEICPRPAAGSEVTPPPDLFSKGGVLHVSLNYYTTVDQAGRTLFCYQTPDGLESPTLHANPGDEIVIDLTNTLPPGSNPHFMVNASAACRDRQASDTTINMHFHGLNISPKCHSDETIHTLINSGEAFTYKLKIPANEPPGLYWYHPHVHEFASPAVQGGATGAIVVEGIENIQPAVAGLPQRLLVLRDEPLLNPGAPGKGLAPFWDISANYVPVPYPDYTPGIIRMTVGTQEFWRVANAAANTIMDLEVDYDGKPQVLQVVGLDGVPTGSQDGKRQGMIVSEKHLLIPPASRAEFILAAPTKSTTKAYLITRAIDGGSGGDSNPRRPIAQIVASAAGRKLPRLPERSRPPHPQRFEDASKLKATGERKLYFWETSFAQHRKPPADAQKFYIAVEGEDVHVYDPNDPPDITTTKGAIEDWIIENHTVEVHEFHIHQIHFLVLQVNGKNVSAKERQWRDTYQVPYWTGSGPYPSIKVRMDFRGAVVGDFVYHCHILDHEDRGMMAIIRVLPKKT